MPRPLLDLWRLWVPLTLVLLAPLLALVLAIVVIPVALGVFKPVALGVFAPVALGVFALSVVGCWRTPPLCIRLVARAWSFASTSGASVRLHYARELRPEVEQRRVLETCEQDLVEVASLFGFSLRGRLVVYLFASREDVSHICGRNCHGAALMETGAVLISLPEKWPELFRHEVAHLLSRRLGRLEPALKSEGLAVWAAALGEQSYLDQWAVLVHLFEKASLLAMVDDLYFRDLARETPCYQIAGSFTGYLIRRYGWQAYVQFYRRAGRKNFHKAFERAFGVTFAEAEGCWRLGLPTLESFSPEFFSKIGIDRETIVRCLTKKGQKKSAMLQ